ncbi:MAG TPA: dockerin type I domain-containing protein, partial [Planctomycetota bacterium]|nr:dockerin type I domain-containing protein [Planctomycetota bacterium]
DGDANGDCRVNILDLIFIRNKLNQPVGTGDNWKADVNEDARINILDLIFVRNKLNTQCP